MNLKTKIIKFISKNGPIKLSSFIKIINSDLEYGYYNLKNDIIGEKGDFITSPEISSVFSEIISIKIAKFFEENRLNNSLINIVEYGPGNYTLSNDILNTIGSFKDFKNSKISLSYLDINKNKHNCLKTNLKNNIHSINLVDNYRDIEFKKNNVNIFIAHEFFDALPTDLFFIRSRECFEVLINYCDGKFKFILSPFQKGIYKKEVMAYLYEHINDNHTLEISTDTLEILCHLKSLFIKHPNSLGIIIDYGYNNPSEFSLRSIHNHKFVDLFHPIDNCDFSSNVDFKFMTKILNYPSIILDISTQGKFLINNGILERLDSLFISKSPEEFYDIKKKIHHLLSYHKMGKIYKVLCIRSLSP